MSDRDWRALVEMFADGRPICNCGDAYYATDGEYMVSGKPGKFNDGLHCKHGCSANLIIAKQEIAGKVRASFERALEDE